MDGLSKKLTEKDVTEALSQRKELLECYRQRLAMLSKEYEDSGELYEKQKKKYQEEIYQNMMQIMESIDRVKYVYLYYLQLPPKEQSVLKAIYIEGKSYKEIITEGLSEQKINRLRKKAIQAIIHNQINQKP